MHFLLDFETIIPLCIGLFFAIVFIQSGLDKVFDWSGNLAWLKGHFKSSFLGKMVPVLLGVVMVTEILAGAFSLVGVVEMLVSGSKAHLKLGVVMSLLSLLMLLFGQRIAKDYEGAKTIAIYFGIALLSALILM